MESEKKRSCNIEKLGVKFMQGKWVVIFLL